jgi:GNAT superfamily N-acetyltransferase
MLAIRHRTDTPPSLPPIPGLIVRRVVEPNVMAEVQGRAASEMADRFAAGHRAYVAYLDGEPAAFGWVATRSAFIGELSATFEIGGGDRYLWNFVTRPSHRGKGIYPRLIDAIVRVESLEAERFWIAYAPENHASGAGIRKAGFVAAAKLSFDSAGRAAVTALSEAGSVAAGALGLRQATETLSECWRCARAKLRGGSGVGEMGCAGGRCCCDYQRPEVECAA